MVLIVFSRGASSEGSTSDNGGVNLPDILLALGVS